MPNMASSLSLYNHNHIPYFILPILVLLLNTFVHFAFSGTLVEYLPGYKGKLPFHLETGYVSVDDSELFYYFIESQGDPTKDPFMLWLTGGPGCSVLNAIIYQLGPMQFDIHNYPGGLPSLIPWEEAWTKTANILFVDSPIGAGYSYSRTQAGWHSSDTKAADQVFQFLVKWLVENPKYLSLELIIGGDSYTGMFVLLVQGIWTNDIMEPNCKFASPRDPEIISAPRRFLRKNSGNNLLVESTKRCRTFNYTLSHIWANNPQVIEALHVRKVDLL
ncbi:hypothetical protein QQ045_011362 [Rhodiola kirilowii]